MNKTVAIIVILVVVLGGWALLRGRSEAPLESGNPAGTVEEGSGANVGADDTNSLVDPTPASVKEFSVEGGMFYFTPKTMTVNKGDTVRITFTNKEGTHDWKLDEFNAATKVLKAGESQTIEFVASTSGSFEYYCSVGTHRQMGMKGTLIVN